MFAPTDKPIGHAPFSAINSAMISFTRASIGPPITRRRYFGHHTT
jgi:hypothetical protein